MYLWIVLALMPLLSYITVSTIVIVKAPDILANSGRAVAISITKPTIEHYLEHHYFNYAENALFSAVQPVSDNVYIVR